MIRIIRKDKDRSSGSYFVCLELFASNWEFSYRAGKETLLTKLLGRNVDRTRPELPAVHFRGEREVEEGIDRAKS